jgi:hypothetical protein
MIQAPGVNATQRFSMSLSALQNKLERLSLTRLFSLVKYLRVKLGDYPVECRKVDPPR